MICKRNCPDETYSYSEVLELKLDQLFKILSLSDIQIEKLYKRYDITNEFITDKKLEILLKTLELCIKIWLSDPKFNLGNHLNILDFNKKEV